jgi:hypothetical protein
MAESAARQLDAKIDTGHGRGRQRVSAADNGRLSVMAAGSSMSGGAHG